MAKKTKSKSVTIIATVFNEAATVLPLLRGLRKQATMPMEVIIVDGGSTDTTVSKMQRFAKKYPEFPLKIFQKKGNRSSGRNQAVKAAAAQLIAVTDAGCVPKKNWLEELLAAYQENVKRLKTKELVVAGYYMAQPKTAFQEAVVPYALVMPDKVDPQIFLPSTRSMLMPKKLWQQQGGLDENLIVSEDYAFARQLRAENIPIVFAQHAQVIWQPRKNFPKFCQMIYSFARGDILAGIVRPKVLLIFARYAIGVALLIFLLWFGQIKLAVGLAAIFIALYSIWAVMKNIRSVPNGWPYLPLLQVSSDAVVMAGTLAGIHAKITRK